MTASDPAVLRQIRDDLDALAAGRNPGSVPELRWLAGRVRDRRCRDAVTAAVDQIEAAATAARATLGTLLG